MRLDERVLSRHRIPQPYRALLTALWITPQIIFIVLAVGRDSAATLLDPRLWLPLGLMALPALYFWREGVDVLERGLCTRVHVTRYHAYESLSAWTVEQVDRTRILTIQDKKRRTIFQSHAAHLTDLDCLMHALAQHIDERESR